MDPKEQAVSEFIQDVIKNPDMRKDLVKKSHLYFFYTYFSDYATYKIAPFQKEWFKITENDKISLSVIVAFRSSAKSTIMTMSDVLWSIMGSQEKKFVLILSQTQDQAKQHFKNLKKELEENKLLQNDLGPFKEDEWNNSTLVLPRYNARITAASTEQSIRGLRHGRHRPDLIICDDVENTASVKTPEGRNKTYDWFNSEVVPLGSEGTRIIVIGNLLHEDSLIKRLEHEIKNNERSGLFRKYPIIDEKGKIYWPGRFPNMDAVEALRKKIKDPFAWNREFKLLIIDDRERVIDPKWIQDYSKIQEPDRYMYTRYVTGVDLAYKNKETSNFTAMVSAKVIGTKEERMIFVLPNPVNARLKHTEIKEVMRGIAKSNGGENSTTLFVEEVGAQGWLTQDLADEGYDAVGVPIRGMDKRVRLQMTANLIYEGRIVFPETGCEELLHQILNFGTAKYDDLVDAFTTMVLGAINNEKEPQQVFFIDLKGFYDR